MRNYKNSKEIWVFHHYATPPTMNGFTRPYNFAKNMIGKNYNTTIFSASYLHFSDINIIENKVPYVTKSHSGVDFVFLNTPSSLNSTTARVRNMLAYYSRLFSVTKIFLKQYKLPDLIYASSPHPLTLIAGIKIAGKYKIPCVCEIRDLWPESLFAFGKIKKDSLLGKLLTVGEHWIYKNANALVLLKEGYIDYLKEKKWTTEQGGKIDIGKCYYINNGVDIDIFNDQIKNEKLKDKDLENNKFNVIYTGAIRTINNIGNILSAAKLLIDKKNIQFIICGNGDQLEMLKRRIVNEKITNVKMKGYIDKKYIPYILSKSNVNILNYSQSKYNWSRGNSSNKLFEYMASGKPIISTIKMGYSIIKKYDCGISLKNDTPEDLASAVMEIYKMPKERYNELGNNAKEGVKDFDFKFLTKKLISLIESLI
jgi:glycosyltransferase involved in cell wall biosynthesis